MEIWSAFGVHRKGTAERWADRILNYSPDQNVRIARMFSEIFSRPPSEVEMELAGQFLDEQRDSYGPELTSTEEDKRPWQDLCHALFNVKEFIFVE